MVETGARTYTSEAQEEKESGKRGRGKRRSRENRKDQEVLVGVEGRVGDEVGPKRPRGRPAGSKNKPKPSIAMMGQENHQALRAHVLHISDGCDVRESVAIFACRRQEAICVLSGSGTVSNATLRQPEAPDTILSLHGRFEILSLSGSFLLPPATPGASGLTVQLAGGQGEVVGGRVAGTLVASGPVLIFAASFIDAKYDHLPLDEEEPVPMQLESQSSYLTASPQHTDSSPMPPNYQQRAATR